MKEQRLTELRELVEFLRENDIAEFDLEREDLKIRLKFAGAVPAVATPSTPPALLAAPTLPVTTPAPVAPSHPNHQVKSPLVGTFYESPSPGSPSFVSVGDHVEVGQVLCIVEAMKLMNEVESDVAGEVVARIASSGQPVEYGQPLFEIKASNVS